MQEKHVKTTKTADWNAFLRILAPQFIDRHTDLTISEEDETISFEIETSRVKAFQEHFDRVLQNSESLDLQLSYQQSAEISSSSSSSGMQIFESPPMENLDQAKNFMRKLFGENTMSGKSDVPINFDSYFVNYESGVLTSALKSDIFGSHALAKFAQQFLCLHLNGVNVHALRQIIAGNVGVDGDPMHLKAPSGDISDDTRGEGFVQTCFGIFEDNTDLKKTAFQMYFDIGRFLQLVYPPQSEVEKINESKARITISLSHLLLYVKQLSRHGLLFTVELKHGKVNAHPLLLPHRERVAKSLSVSILLDDSGSMECYRENLFKSVQSLIQRIATAAPEAEIHLTIFSGVGQKRECTEKAEQFNFDCFEHASLNGQTALYDSMVLPLKTMKNRLKTHNNLLIILTDGKDNNSEIGQEAILSEIKAIQQAVSGGAAPPVIYALGCGNVDEKVLNALAVAAGDKEYIETDNAEGFNKIVNKIEGFEYGRVMAEFTTEIEGKEEKYSLPICLNGQPCVVHEVTIPLSKKPIQVSFKAPTAGQELALNHVTLQITKTQAQKFMEGYGQEIETIHKDVMPFAKKIAMLNNVGGQIDEFCKKAPQQTVIALAADLHIRINQYTAILRDTITLNAENEPTRMAGLIGRGSPILSGNPAPSRVPALSPSPSP